MQVAVIGGGSWGTTIASLVSQKLPTTLWCRNPEIAERINSHHENHIYLPGLPLSESLKATTSIPEAVSGANIVAVAVPSHALRAEMQLFAEHIPADATLLSLTKGLEQKTHLRMTQVLAEVLPSRPLATLSGPNLAKEVLSGQVSATVIASETATPNPPSTAQTSQSPHQSAPLSPQPRSPQQLCEIFATESFHAFSSADIIGTELAGGLKNVVALATGIAAGQGAGLNTQAAVVAKGFSEIFRLGTAMGGDPATFTGIAGIGDLMATCFSPQSRNLKLGIELSAGRALKEITTETPQVAEGVRTAESAVELGRERNIAMPVSEEVWAVLNSKRSSKEAYSRLCSLF